MDNKEIDMTDAAHPQQLVNAEKLIGSERDLTLDWLESVDRHGLEMTLESLGELLDSAPDAARMTPEYHYLRGYHDHKFLVEEIA
jgi:hypothetical protein